MSGYRRRSSSSGGRGSRWMDLRYAGACKVCGSHIPKGARGYWDADVRTVTCTAIACASADGLTTVKSPTGPWDKWEAHEVLSERRIGSPAPATASVVVARFNSGAVAYVNTYGRCEDAPCCGCCS